MFLVRLIYVSTVVQPFSENDIQQILTAAQTHNTRLNVTGMLCFNTEYFLQCLEGSRESVNELYKKILKDPRHQNIYLLKYEELHQRKFANWAMGYVPKVKLTEAVNLKYSCSREFTPMEMSGESCLNMMLELAETVPTI